MGLFLPLFLPKKTPQSCFQFWGAVYFRSLFLINEGEGLNKQVDI